MAALLRLAGGVADPRKASFRSGCRPSFSRRCALSPDCQNGRLTYLKLSSSFPPCASRADGGSAPRDYRRLCAFIIRRLSEGRRRSKSGIVAVDVANLLCESPLAPLKGWAREDCRPQPRPTSESLNLSNVCFDDTLN
jgi:hypothetical protein